jgi:hypothetical protein
MTDRNLEAYCGLYCGACPVLLRRPDDWVFRTVREHLGAEADLVCRGCRSGTVSVSCRDCDVRDCAQSRDLDSCSACPEMPCDRLVDKSTRLPHTAEILDNLARLRDAGPDVWLVEQARHWTCPSCRQTGSWYETVCADCGRPLPAGHRPPTDG